MSLPTNLPQTNYIQGFWKLEEESGVRYDETDNNNDLSDYHTVGYSASGKIGNAADFEVSNEEALYITDESQQGLAITGPITVNAWTKPESLGSNNIITKWSASTDWSYRLFITSGSKLAFYVSSDGTDAYAVGGATNLNIGIFQMVTGVYDGSYLYVYLNGSSDAPPVEYNSGIYDSSSPFRIGCEYTGIKLINFFDGLIDEAIVWNKALTPEEITALYAITEYSYGYSLIVSDNLALEDTEIENSKMVVQLIDDIGLQEAKSESMLSYPSHIDNIDLGGQNGKITEMPLSISNEIAIGSLKSLSTMLVNSDGIKLEDINSLLATMQLSKTDDFFIGDSKVTLITVYSDRIDRIKLEDSLISLTQAQLESIDSVVLSDESSISVIVMLYLSKSDSIKISDVRSIPMTFQITKTDGVELADSENVVNLVQSILEEAISIGSTVSLIQLAIIERLKANSTITLEAIKKSLVTIEKGWKSAITKEIRKESDID